MLNSFHSVAGSLSGCGQWLSLTILGASALLSVRECSGYCRRLFCTVMLGQHQQCRTPCVEGKTDASWNFTVSTDFIASSLHWITQENIWRVLVGEWVEKNHATAIHRHHVTIGEDGCTLNSTSCTAFIVTHSNCVMYWGNQTECECKFPLVHMWFN